MELFDASQWLLLLLLSKETAKYIEQETPAFLKWMYPCKFSQIECKGHVAVHPMGPFHHCAPAAANAADWANCGCAQYRGQAKQPAGKGGGDLSCPPECFSLWVDFQRPLVTDEPHLANVRQPKTVSASVR